MKRQKMKRAKELYLQDLCLGVGAIIGAGLFSLTGIAAAENAGPASPIIYISRYVHLQDYVMLNLHQ
jgi:APA family basic amino acid/polyamine antiporter